MFEDECEFFRCAAKYWIPRVRSNPSAKDFAIVYMCERPNGRIATKYFIWLLLVIKSWFIIILLLDVLFVCGYLFSTTVITHKGLTFERGWF